MKALLRVKVGNEMAGGITVPNIDTSPWLSISANPLSIVDVTSLPVIPAEGSAWDGERFDTPSTREPLPGYISLAFIVDGKCAHVMPLSPTFNPALIAAFRSGATIEVELDPPADATYDTE
jgi:hypothetical protein